MANNRPQARNGLPAAKAARVDPADPAVLAAAAANVRKIRSPPPNSLAGASLAVHSAEESPGSAGGLFEFGQFRPKAQGWCPVF